MFQSDIDFEVLYVCASVGAKPGTHCTLATLFVTIFQPDVFACCFPLLQYVLTVPEFPTIARRHHQTYGYLFSCQQKVLDTILLPAHCAYLQTTKSIFVHCSCSVNPMAAISSDGTAYVTDRYLSTAGIDMDWLSGNNDRFVPQSKRLSDFTGAEQQGEELYHCEAALLALLDPQSHNVLDLERRLILHEIFGMYRVIDV